MWHSDVDIGAIEHDMVGISGNTPRAKRSKKADPNTQVVFCIEAKQQVPTQTHKE